MTSKGIEDYLETIYLLASEGQTVIGARLAERLHVSAPSVTEMLQRLAQDGYVTVGERKEISLTPAGFAVAEATMRRHRVVERWLTDDLGMDWVQAHEVAHRLEHAITTEVSERLFSALGQPTTCPHGNYIPGSGAEPFAGTPLDRVPVGTVVVVDRIREDGEQLPQFLTQLGELGIRPGVCLRVEERAPWSGTVSIHQGERSVTLDREATTRIWVRQASAETSASNGHSDADQEALATVVMVRGACRAGHRPGEQFVLGSRTPAGLCSEAFLSLYRLVEDYHARLPLPESERTRLEVPCPEGGAVVFRLEIRRDGFGQSD